MRRAMFYGAVVVLLLAFNFATFGFFFSYFAAQHAAGGAVPECTPGDVNGDESASVADAVYLLQYLFLNGPTPQNCAAAAPAARDWPPAPSAIVTLSGHDTMEGIIGTKYTVYQVPEDSVFVVTQCVAEGTQTCDGAYNAFATFIMDDSGLKLGADTFVVGPGDFIKFEFDGIGYWPYGDHLCAFAGQDSEVEVHWFVQGYLVDAKTGTYPVADPPNPTDMVVFSGGYIWDSVGDQRVVYTVPEGKRLMLTEFTLPTTLYELELIEKRSDEEEITKFTQCSTGPRTPYVASPQVIFGFSTNGGHELPLFFESGSELIVRRYSSFVSANSTGEYFGVGYLIDEE